MSPETLNMSIEVWKSTFMEPTFSMWGPKPSTCSMYNVTEETLPGFLTGESQPMQV